MNSGQFKFKPDKIKYLTNVSTLDSSHTKIIDDINKKKNFLPKKEKKLEKLKCMLKELDDNSRCVDNYVYLKSKIIEDIDILTNEIEEINNHDDEINYFSKTYNILFNYYDQYDGINNNDYIPPQPPQPQPQQPPQPPTTQPPPQPPPPPQPQPQLQSSKHILGKEKVSKSEGIGLGLGECEGMGECEGVGECEGMGEGVGEGMGEDDLDILFKKSDKVDKLELLNQLSKQKRKEKKTTRKRIKNIETLVKDNNNIFSYLEKGKLDEVVCNKQQKQPKVYQDKATLFEEFRLVIDGVQTHKKINKFCINCNIDKILIYSEGTYTCTNCGEVESCIVESDITSYKDPMIEKPTFPYKRKNHFCEWINYLNCSLKYIPFILRAKYILISFL
jgi:hypothetical protein